MKTPSRASIRFTTAMAVGLALIVSGCGQAVTDPGQPSASRTPVVDANCGVTTTYTSIPKRVVSLTSNATETLLELGLQDAMVGTAYLRGREIAPKYQEAYGKIPILSSEQPTMEQILAVNPDFVYSGYPDGFSDKTGHNRQQLKDKGIDAHLNPEGCSKAKVSVNDIYSEITTIGNIFRVPERATASNAALKARVEAVQAKIGQRRVRVFLYASGTDKAATTGGNSMATALIEAAGGENIFSDVGERWMSVSWEQVAERNPDIILVREEGTTPQYQSPSVESKIATLKGVAAISGTTAIQRQAFATLTLSQLQPGPYSIDGVEHMARQFHPEAFK